MLISRSEERETQASRTCSTVSAHDAVQSDCVAEGQPDDEHVLDDVGARFFWAPPHIIDFKLDKGSADFRFDFAFGFHAEAVRCKSAGISNVRREVVI